MRTPTPMARRWTSLVLLVLAALASVTALASDGRHAAPAWRPWSDQVFADAKRDGKFVLLDLEAVWCHWCHVMDEKTYTDPSVLALLRKHYVTVKVDSDAHPELARRYENFGWPATVVYAADGTEIVKRRGYLRPEIMVSMLEAVVRDPSPVHYPGSEPIDRWAGSAVLAPKLRAELERRHVDSHDQKAGGFDQMQKFLDRDTLEYALLRATSGARDAKAEAMLRLDLDAALALIDPVWGGMYQYSTDGDWRHPHYEKIMQIQADAMRAYALAWSLFSEPRYRKAAEDIHRYVLAFLTSPEGAFYVSQDADLVKGRHSEDYFAKGDAGRRAQGLPAVDTHVYARENGWMIQSLVALHEATGEQRFLDEAARAARWIVAHRALPSGGFRHGERDNGGPWLEDTLSMGRAQLALYQAGAGRDWLARAERAAAFADRAFRSPAQPGYMSATAPAAAVLKPEAVIDENIAAARFGNALARHTGNAKWKAMAEHAMRFLVTDAVALRRRSEAGILVAADELESDPAHITVVGAKDDPSARALFRAALAVPAVYRRIEWWDRREGAMPNPDVRYPQLTRAAAFLCSNGACSQPIFEAGEVAPRATELARR